MALPMSSWFFIRRPAADCALGSFSAADTMYCRVHSTWSDHSFRIARCSESDAGLDMAAMLAEPAGDIAIEPPVVVAQAASIAADNSARLDPSLLALIVSSLVQTQAAGPGETYP